MICAVTPPCLIVNAKVDDWTNGRWPGNADILIVKPDDARTMMISCVSHFPLLLGVTVAFTGTMLLPGIEFFEIWQNNELGFDSTCWTRRVKYWSGQASQSWAGSASPTQWTMSKLNSLQKIDILKNLPDLQLFLQVSTFLPVLSHQPENLPDYFYCAHLK